LKSHKIVLVTDSLHTVHTSQCPFAAAL